MESLQDLQNQIAGAFKCLGAGGHGQIRCEDVKSVMVKLGLSGSDIQAIFNSPTISNLQTISADDFARHIVSGRVQEQPEKSNLMSPARYIQLLQKGEVEGIEEADLEHLRGRFCYGKLPSEFSKLGHPEAKTCFVLGADGLHLILTHAAKATREGSFGLSMEVLLSIGYDVLQIYHNVVAGSVTELVVFPASSVRHEPATWHGASRLLVDVFPKAAPAVCRHVDELRMKGSEPLAPAAYKQLEADYFESYAAQQISITRFDRAMPFCEEGKRASCSESTLDKLGSEAQAHHARAFLCHYCGMNPLFGGNGYTIPDGSVRRLEVPSIEKIVAALDIPNEPSKSAPWNPPKLAKDLDGIGEKGDLVVRVENADEIHWTDDLKVQQKMHTWEGWRVITLISKGWLREYLAINADRSEMSELRSTPIGQPVLEQCVMKIAELAREARERRFGELQSKGPYFRVLRNWVDVDTDLTWESSDDFDGMCYRLNILEEPSGKGELGTRGLVLTIADPSKTGRIAQTLRENTENAALEVLLMHYHAIDIYSRIKKGHSYHLVSVPWKPWQPGAKNDDCEQFPATRAGISQFLKRYFPRVVQEYPFDPYEYGKSSPERNNSNWDALAAKASERDVRTINNTFLTDFMSYEVFTEVADGKRLWPSSQTGSMQTSRISALHVRAFFAHVLAIGANWTGLNTFVMLDPTKVHYWWIMKNRGIHEIENAKIIPLGSPTPVAVMQRIAREYKSIRDMG
eukprot:TRINITY_DN63469_c0_g1_i1.p1 TRINITY_DN63469_c0_g1~~TRINITY_DN63469_c0_g1_i1.p1  ORF type:complete len:744 (-),score=99.93 TRINITY_DN63469_c0_g1_i1:127-2358(-)